MQSQESSPQTTEGDQDRPEKAGDDDGRIIDKADASRAMSRGGEDEMMPAPEGHGQPTTTKEVNEGAGINLDPPTVDILSLTNSPVGSSSARSTASPVQVASVSGPLEHLSLDDWKATDQFDTLRNTIEQFFQADRGSLESSLSVPLAMAVEASYTKLFRKPNYRSRYPQWTTGSNMAVLLPGNPELYSVPMCQIYHERLRKEIKGRGREAGLSEEQVIASAASRSSYGPCLPDIICQANLEGKKVWTHVQEHKVRKSRQDPLFPSHQANS